MPPEQRIPLAEESQEAVDDSLIQAMRRLTPLERLRQNDRMLQTIVGLRAAFAQRKAASDREGETR